MYDFGVEYSHAAILVGGSRRRDCSVMTLFAFEYSDVDTF
jgi:hypothetical protein